MAAADPGSEVKTKNARFQRSSFNELPGWGRDDLMTAWDALRSSCSALDQRDTWKSLCASAQKTARNTPEVRRFFEREFSLVRILNADATPDGDVTGYYEPLLAGSLRREGSFTVPVYGVPNDLYTIDWKSIPAAQRRAIVQVMPQGRELRVVDRRQAGSYALDTTQFVLDARDRRWRVRLDNDQARPYRTREEIDAGPALDAQVLAWVDDPLALYAMQVQGSGRIRLRDGRVLRLQYADQNGHPFKPLRVAARPSQTVVTRGIGNSQVEEPERFDLVDAAGTGRADVEDDGDAVVTRGLSGTASSGTGSAPRAVAPSARGDSLVDELLSSARRSSSPSVVATKPAAVGTKRPSTLNSDPSYVFFRVAPDQSPSGGPIGALGVPLTPGRSIAVDPRVTPMGYPVYMVAPTPAGSPIALQRLVLAQDTGGAIRGAVRADFFWGFGHEAGRQAMRTKQRAQMWLMLPHAEASRVLGTGFITRSARGFAAATTANSECLVADDAFCVEPDR
jgi:membrane-bound lytic murein transglycosylase A